MKRLFIFITVVYFCFNLMGDSLKVQRLDTSNYPLINATISVIDDSGRAKKIDPDSSILINMITNIDEHNLRHNVSPGYILLLLDKSGSMRSAMKPLKKAVKYFIDLLPDYFFVAIIAFDRKPKLIADFTQDKVFLKKIVDKLYAKGATALYDSIYLGLKKLSLLENKNTYLIVLTDGKDQTYEGSPPLSKHSLKEVINYANELNIPCFTIALGNEADYDVMKKIANRTRGIFYNLPEAKDLINLYKLLANNLARIYTLSFYSPYLVYDGRRVETNITLKNNNNVLKTKVYLNVPDLDEHYFDFEKLVPTKVKQEQNIRIIITDKTGRPIDGYFQVIANGKVVKKGKISSGEGSFILKDREIKRDFSIEYQDIAKVPEKPLLKPSRVYIFTITHNNEFVPMEGKLKGRYNHKYYTFITNVYGLGEGNRLTRVVPGEYILELGQNGQVLLYDNITVNSEEPLILKYRFSKIIITYNNRELSPALKTGLNINILDKESEKYILYGKRLFFFTGNDSVGFIPPGKYKITLTDAIENDNMKLKGKLTFDLYCFGDDEIFINIPEKALIIKK